MGRTFQPKGTEGAKVQKLETASAWAGNGQKVSVFGVKWGWEGGQAEELRSGSLVWFMF